MANGDPPPLLSRFDVANLLEVPLKQLTWWVIALDEHKRYRYFEIERRSGGTPRPIQAPIKPIKDIQRRLADVLSDCYAPPVNVHGFVMNRGPRSNAAPHRRKEWVLRLDLEDFFPTIHFGRVRGLFMAYPFEYPEQVATLLAQICCHRQALPQGAPTSPIVSNYICRRMDTRLAQLARAERCHYTRYADDLCFSTDRTTFPTLLGANEAGVAVAGSRVAEIVIENGFSLNAHKTRLMRRTQRQQVTGLVVNTKANVPRNYIRSVRNLLYVWQRYGEESAVACLEKTDAHANWPPAKPRPQFRQVVRGRVQYVGSVKGWRDPVYLRLAEALSRVDDSFEPPASVPVPGPHTVRVFTEGASDDLHFAAASAYFASRGEFTDLFLEVEAYGERRGDEALLRHCESLSITAQHAPCVCVFDRDVPKMIAKIVDGKKDWKNWGNGVASVALAAPGWRRAADPFCIEMLYSDEVLRRVTPEGRRLFLAEEFDQSKGFHKESGYFTPYPKGKGLVREGVYDTNTQESVGLSKLDFAKAVVEASAPFENVDFEGFRPTFIAIRNAVGVVARDVGSR